MTTEGVKSVQPEQPIQHLQQPVQPIHYVQQPVQYVQAVPPIGPQRNNMQQSSTVTNTNVSVNVGNGRKVNHFFYCVLTVCTGGACLPCWCGACIGACPACD